MLDNEQIVTDLENDHWAYYYSVGHSCEVIREVHRNKSGNLFIKFPNWGLVPLTKDGPEILLGKVPTSLELTTRISKLEDEVKRLNSLLEANRLLTRSAIHNMVQPEQVGGHIYGCPQPDEIRPVKAEPTAAQEREAIVTWLRSEPIYRNRPWAVISADIERGEHWPTEEKP